MLTSLDHQGNASHNLNDRDIISPQLEWLLSRRQKLTNVSEDVEKW
jgi:hypothetical protein